MNPNIKSVIRWVQGFASENYVTAYICSENGMTLFFSFRRRYLQRLTKNQTRVCVTCVKYRTGSLNICLNLKKHTLLFYMYSSYTINAPNPGISGAHTTRFFLKRSWLVV